MTANPLVDAPEDAITHAYLHDFITRWAPADPYDRTDFEAQLIRLFMRGVADATRPHMKMLCDALAVIPNPLILRAPDK